MLISLSPLALVFVDAVLWLLIHLGFAWALTHLPPGRFSHSAPLFRQRAFERQGKLYEQVFHITSWKKHLPDGAALFRRGFRKRRLVSKDPSYLARFRQETCRAELVHWSVLLLAPAFLLWNPPIAAAANLAYALCANLPCILAQRYNRCRLNQILAGPAGHGVI